MDAEQSRIRDLVASEFGSEMQRDAIAHVWKVYEAAWQTAREFERPQRRKVYGHHKANRPKARPKKTDASEAEGA